VNTTFTDFLREQAEQRKAQSAERAEVTQEWIDSIKRLYATITGWLQKSDPDGILKIRVIEDDLNEEGLGKYTVPHLDIRGLGRWVGIVPKARYTVATAHPPQKNTPERAAGRVDITNEVRRFVLYRFIVDGQDVWMIDDQKHPPKVLDQEAFEAALMSYLR
jgi:hypothetical protein